MRSSRILMYCQDSLGLGHLRRATNIAWSLYELDSAVEIVIVADSPAAPFFPLPPGCRIVKLPTLVKVDTGVWASPLSSVIGLDEVSSLRVDLLRSIASTFRPDAVLVDHMAKGAMRELEPTIDVLRQRRGVHLVLGLRDILGDPDVLNRQWADEGVHDLIAEHYDQILVYGCRDLFDLPAVHGFDRRLGQKTTFCGYVTPRLPPRRVKRQGGDRTVLVMAGGGHDGFRMIDATLRALPHLARPLELSITVLTGPFLDKDESARLRARADGFRVTFDRMRPDTLPDLMASDLCVSMCGYNTMTEVLLLRTPAVVVPRLGPSAEQRIRARLFDERGLVRSVLDREIDEASFGLLLEDETLTAREPEARPELDGGRVAAAALLRRDPQETEREEALVGWHPPQ